jgi:NADPH:quinone reductase-like Zn-dependent oxidoreductase
MARMTFGASGSKMPALRGGAGPDWILDKVDVPDPGPGQVLVGVRAAGINRADLYMLQGTYKAGAQNLSTFTAGLELAGEVAALGAGVAGFAIGDRVMGTTVGAFAPFALADARHLVMIPPDLSWVDAGALPVGLTTEHDALVTQGGFTTGQAVLIVGATSGVGMIGVQVAKALGASLVIATTTSTSKIDALQSVGADLVVNTATDDLVEVVQKATSGAGVDIALDHIGGDVFPHLLTATRIQGTIINIGRLAGAKTTIDLDQLAFKRLRLIGTTFSIRTNEERAEVAAALIPEILPAVADGRIRAVVADAFPLSAAKKAADLLRENAIVGKLVLTMPSASDDEQ